MSLIHRKNSLDNKTLSEMYVPSNSVLVKATTWNTRDEELPDPIPWNHTDFLASGKRLMYIAAAYGIGKTSWSCKLVADLAEKNLSDMFSEYFPIHIPLRHGLSRVDDDGDNLDAILSLLKDNTKILFIYDALDEFQDTEIGQLLEKIQINLSKYPDSKAIITTRPNFDFQSKLRLDEYVRLSPFSNDQVSTFFSNYGLPLDYEIVAKSGLESDEIRKPLFCWMIALVYDESILTDRNKFVS